MSSQLDRDGHGVSLFKCTRCGHQQDASAGEAACENCGGPVMDLRAVWM